MNKMIRNKNSALINSRLELRIDSFCGALAGIVMLTFALPGLGFAQTGSAAGEEFLKSVYVLSTVYAAANEDANSSECKSASWSTYDVHQLITKEVVRLKPEYTHGVTTKQLESLADSLVTSPSQVQNGGTKLVAITRSKAHKEVDNYYIKALKDLAPLTRCGVLPGYYENWINNLQESLRPYQH